MCTNNYNDVELTNLRMAHKDEQFVQRPTNSHTAGFVETIAQHAPSLLRLLQL